MEEIYLIDGTELPHEWVRWMTYLHNRGKSGSLLYGAGKAITYQMYMSGIIEGVPDTIDHTWYTLTDKGNRLVRQCLVLAEMGAITNVYY